MVKLQCTLYTLPELQGMLVGLMLADCAQMQARRIPPLLTCGVRYRREGRGAEQWQTARECLEVGHGDCEDLAAWRAAELRMQGERATPIVRRIRDGLVHCLVRRASGTVEDPSAALGMRGKG